MTRIDSVIHVEGTPLGNYFVGPFEENAEAVRMARRIIRLGYKVTIRDLYPVSGELDWIEEAERATSQ